MAFVSLSYGAQRNKVTTNTEGARNPNLGPGAYLAEKPQSKQFGCKPTFMTSTGRNGKAA